MSSANIVSPELYASTGFVVRAGELGVGVAVNPVDVPKVTQIARHEAMHNLGALLIHGPSETIDHQTSYRLVRDLPDGKTTFDTDYLSRDQIEADAAERKLAVLALKGVEPTEKNLSQALYRAAVTKDDPNSDSLPPDVWLGTTGGATLGLAGYVIGVGLERFPADPLKLAIWVASGALAGLLIMPRLRAARGRYDMKIVEGLRPIKVYPRIVPK